MHTMQREAIVFNNSRRLELQNNQMRTMRVLGLSKVIQKCL